MALIGVHYDENEKIKFLKFNFSVEGLDEWLLISGIKVDYNWDAKSATIRYDHPNEIVLQLPEGIELIFTFAWIFPSPVNITEAKITQKAYVSLKSNTLRSLDDFLNLVFKITNFFCFAIDKTVSLNSATGYSNEITKESNDGQTPEIPIKIYYHSPSDSEVKPKLNRNDMLFQYRHVASEIERVLTNWLSNYEIYEPAFNLYFASKSGAHRYIDGRFLSLVQGVETLHRRNSEQTPMPEDEFTEVKRIVLQACPADKQEWLTRKIEYANEFSLGERIKQMLEPFQYLYGTEKDCKSFIRKVKDTRNYFTHYDIKLLSRAATGEDLWNLCMKLECLFQLHFLRLMGLDKEQIDILLKPNEGFRRKLGL